MKRTPFVRSLTVAVPVLLLLAGCQQQPRSQANYEMGERIEIGSLTYTVVESTWRSDLGEGFQLRAPKNRFLMLSVTVTNGGGSEVSVPMLSVEGSGQTYQELTDGSGITNWMGVLRTVGPAATLQGRVVFDVPLGAYRLRLPDGGDTGYEKYAWVNVPLTLDAADVQAPVTETLTK